MTTPGVKAYNCPMKQGSGFTLVELLVTLVIAAVLLGLAAPSFVITIQNNRLVTQVNDFMTSLNLARSEAIKRGTEVAVCRSNTTFTNCNAGAGNWSTGWIVFTDLDSSGTVDVGETILQVHRALSGANTLTGNVNVADLISYTSGGAAAFAAGGTLSFCDLRGSASRRVIILNAAGRARTQKQTGTCP
jgi:type IV fimbrial biogenesis protein FimT